MFYFFPCKDSDVDDFVSVERSVPRSRVRKMAVSETLDSARSTRCSFFYVKKILVAGFQLLFVQVLIA